MTQPTIVESPSETFYIVGFPDTLKTSDDFTTACAAANTYRVQHKKPVAVFAVRRLALVVDPPPPPPANDPEPEPLRYA